MFLKTFPNKKHSPPKKIRGSYKNTTPTKTTIFFAKSRMSDTCFATPSFVFYKNQ